MMNIHLLKHALLLIVCFSTITAKAEHDRREVKVETAGTLSTIITEGAKYKITDLTITGELNGDDIRYLREMAGADFRGNTTQGQLSAIDLSNATIVEGGNYYYRDDKENYSTHNNTLPSFAQCKNLQEFKAPMSVYKHEQYAFYGCTELCEVTLPHSLDTGNYLSQAFYNCPKMKHLYIKKNADRSGHLFESENGGVYYGSYYADRLKEARLLYVPPKTEGTFVVNEKTTTIAFGAMQNCINVREIVLPEGLTTIMDSAFTNCAALSKINLPNSITDIAWKAFKRCQSLTRITLPNQLTRLNNELFAECVNLQQIDMPESIRQIRSQPFKHCSALKSIYIPSLVENIAGRDLFMGCYSLNDIKVSPNNLFFEVMDGALYDIDAHALLACQRSQEVVKMKEGTTWVNSFAFQGCTRLRELTLCETWPMRGNNSTIKSYDLLDVLDGSRWADKGEDFCLSALEKVNIYTPDDTLRNYDGAVYEKQQSYADGSTYWALMYCPSGKTSVRVPEWCKVMYMNLNNIPHLKEIHLEKAYISYADDNYQGVDLSQISVYVPNDCVDIYKNDYWWRSFPNIYPESASAIDAIRQDGSSVLSIYNLQGVPVNKASTGTYIYKYPNGQTKKVIVH